MEIYDVAAQVIPVLLFAMVFESRVLADKPSSYPGGRSDDGDDPYHWNISQAVGRWYALAVLGLGELLALNAVGLGHAGTLTRAIVWGALVLGVVGVLWPLLGRQWSYIRQWLALSRQHGEVGFLVFMVLLLVGVTTGWISLFYS